jgi:hypothetical protein
MCGLGKVRRVVATKGVMVVSVLAALAAAALIAIAPSGHTLLAFGAPGATLTGSITLQDQNWVCSGPVNLNSVTVTLSPAFVAPRTKEDAIKLENGCTGMIGRIEVTTSIADGVKVSQGAHDIQIGGGDIRCLGKKPVLHQDGIQVMGGQRITFRNLSVDCGRANATLINSNMFVNMAGKSTSPPADIVCQSCTFGGDAAHTVSIQNSIRSGIANSRLCVAKYPRLTLDIGPDAVDPVNQGNKIIHCSSGLAKLSFTAPSRAVVYGRALVLSGTLSGLQAAQITLYAKRFRHTTFVPIGTASAVDGHWQFAIHPRIATEYEARAQGTESPVRLVRVRPRLVLMRVRGGVSVRVYAQRVIRGRPVLLERRRHSHWTISRRLVTRGRISPFVATAAVRTGGPFRAVLPAAPGYVATVTPAVSVP